MKKFLLLTLTTALLAGCSFEINSVDEEEQEDPISFEIIENDEEE